MFPRFADDSPLALAKAISASSTSASGSSRCIFIDCWCREDSWPHTSLGLECSAYASVLVSSSSTVLDSRSSRACPSRLELLIGFLRGPPHLMQCCWCFLHRLECFFSLPLGVVVHWRLVASLATLVISEICAATSGYLAVSAYE